MKTIQHHGSTLRMVRLLLNQPALTVGDFAELIDCLNGASVGLLFFSPAEVLANLKADKPIEDQEEFSSALYGTEDAIVHALLWGEGTEWGELTPVEIVALELFVAYRAGLLNRFRTCRCGKWFYARLPNQQSCGQRACSERAYESGETVKARRREYMNWYYAMYQSPKAPRKKSTFKQWLQQQKFKAGRKSDAST